MTADTWKPVPPPPCKGSCCTGGQIPVQVLTAAERAMLWPDVPAAPVTREWVEDTDPSPVTEPENTLTPWWKRLGTTKGTT